MDERQRATKARALKALSLMRRGLSLTAAATQARTTPETVRKYAGRAIDRQSNGHYEARPWDRMKRSVRILTPTGPERITVKDSRTATLISDYWNEIDRFVLSGATEGLKRFVNASFQVDGVKYGFLTDLNQIERLAFAGEISFEDLYAHTT